MGIGRSGDRAAPPDFFIKQEGLPGEKNGFLREIAYLCSKSRKAKYGNDSDKIGKKSVG